MIRPPGRIESDDIGAALRRRDRLTRPQPIAFGPRPGELGASKKQGWKAWVEAQLDPSSINDSELAEPLHQLYRFDTRNTDFFPGFKQPLNKPLGCFKEYKPG